MPISPWSAIQALLLGIRTTCLKELHQNLEEFTEIIENQKWNGDRSETLRNELECFRLGFIEDKQKLKEILSSQDDEAQEWLDLLQLVAEYPNISKAFRTSVFNIMIRLSRSTGLHPRCLTIRNVQKLGRSPIGGGGYGDVWKGRASGRFVCLKIIRATAESDIEQILKDYMREAIVWRQLDHPNLLPFMGIFYLEDESKRLCLISPWMEKGNLHQFLKKAKPEDVKHDSLVLDVASGLSYLHDMKFIHGDLKGDNVLITSELRACITDFGLSRISETQRLIQSSRAISSMKGFTMRWTAPELFLEVGCVASRESDVYAFASVCYEIYTGNVPFVELSDAAAMLAIISHKHPSRPKERPGDSTWKMLEVCWSSQPSSRPTMLSVIGQLEWERLPESADQPRPPCARSWDEPSSTQVWNNASEPTVHSESTVHPETNVRAEPTLPAWRFWAKEVNVEEVPLDKPEEDGIWRPVFNKPPPFGIHPWSGRDARGSPGWGDTGQEQLSLLDTRLKGPPFDRPLLLPVNITGSGAPSPTTYTLPEWTVRQHDGAVTDGPVGEAGPSRTRELGFSGEYDRKRQRINEQIETEGDRHARKRRINGKGNEKRGVPMPATQLPPSHYMREPISPISRPPAPVYQKRTTPLPPPGFGNPPIGTTEAETALSRPGDVNNFERNFGQPDSDINFERDFGQWFNEPDGSSRTVSPMGYLRPPMLPSAEEEALFSAYLHPPMSHPDWGYSEYRRLS